ncbi:LysM domain-containing protein [Halocella sp. SP3-1]|uniref:LysM peptidoglycan-binding domain-containing protein n=1 Tax=Halocella sp. SP3-1 TaxID=2382161 RepID=UPI000F76344E|nr:LysM domain-containing protein [Halocella sp. SP3-1]AZO94634.1 LysM peptidoglycan-binding domain-containing protein [Halocella sp. SP3-1]MTI59323.1 LysM peptidoglycan-binding domain-containing protein [Bacillota bacterium]
MARQCPPNTFSYSIKPGDTFYSIAQRYDTTVPALVSANPGIDFNNLQPGMTICVPRQKQYPSCPEGNYYTIKANDTFFSIARNFNISVDDLREANPAVNPDKLITGQVICIPLATPPVRCPAGTQTYTIQRGDTYYSIAQRFNTTVQRLNSLNPGLNPNYLLIGQQICVPNNH